MTPEQEKRLQHDMYRYAGSKELTFDKTESTFYVAGEELPILRIAYTYKDSKNIRMFPITRNNVNLFCVGIDVAQDIFFS